jgi:predicted PurR-regulated permease PerM
VEAPPATPAAAGAAGPERRRPGWWRWGVVALFGGLLLGLGFYLSEVTNPLLLGLLLAYVLNPIVERLERRGWSRNAAVLVLFGVVLIATSSLLVFSAVKAADHLDDLRRLIAGEPVVDLKDPGLSINERTRLEAGAAGVAFIDSSHAYFDEDGDGARRVGLAEKIAAAASEHLGARLSRKELADLARAYQAQAAAVLSAGVQLTEGLRRSLSQLGTFFGYVLLVPLYTFFLLQSFSSLRDGIRDHLPAAYRPRVVDLARKIDGQVAAFFRGKLLLALLKGLATWLGLWWGGVPFAFFIGMGAGLLSVVPLLGPLCGVPLALVLTWEGTGQWWVRVVWVIGTFGAAEVIEGLAQPVVLGREVGLSPLALILALFVSGELFGFFGVLLAVPIACVAKVLFLELVLPEIRALAHEPGDLAAEGAPAPPPPGAPPPDPAPPPAAPPAGA